MFSTPFSVGVRHELGELSLGDTVAAIQAFGPPGRVRLRSAGGRSLALIETPLVTLLEQASFADRLMDVAALVQAVTPRFLDVTLHEITTVLGGAPIRHGLLQMALTHAPLLRDPPGTYDELVASCPRTIPLNTALRPAAVDGLGGAIPFGLRATRVGPAILLACPHDRMSRGIISTEDGSAVFSKLGAMLRGPLQGLQKVAGMHAGAIPPVPLALDWSLTLSSLPHDVRDRLVALRTLRAAVFAPRAAPPTPIPETPQAKRRRTTEAHLQLVDAMWRGDLQCAVLLLDQGAPAMPPANMPAALRAHLDGPDGPAIVQALARSPSLLRRLLAMGLIMPLDAAAAWVLARPLDLALFEARLDDAFLSTVLLACDASPQASTVVLPSVFARVPPGPPHLRCVRRRGDVMRLLLGAVGISMHRDEALELMAHAQTAAVLAELMDVLVWDDQVLYALFRHPACAKVVAMRPSIQDAVTDDLLDDCVRARWMPAFRSLVRQGTPRLVDICIDMECAEALACVLERGGVVEVPHVVTVIEASEFRIHPVFWTLIRAVSTDMVRAALTECCVPIFLACDALRGLRRQRPPVPLEDARRLLECLRDAGVFIPTASHFQRLCGVSPDDVSRLLTHLVMFPHM